MTALFRLGSAAFKEFRPARRFSGTFFSLAVAPSRDGKTRFACVVSKKVSPKAVVRNTVKRRARAAANEAARGASPVTLVLTAKHPAASAGYSDIKADIGALFGRI